MSAAENPARLAYLLKKFPRLSETFVLNEILGLEREGLALHVFARRPRDPEPDHPELARLRAPIELLGGERGLDPLRELFTAEREEPSFFARVGALVRECERFGHARLSGLFGEALHLRRRCRELGIAHVHVHFATDSAVTAFLLHRLGGPTYSVTAHAKDIYRSTVNRELLDALIGESEFTVTVCDANVRELAAMLSPAAAARVRRSYNGIDLRLFRDRGQRRDEGHVLGVGRLIEKKGFHVLIDALALLRERDLDVRTTIVGDGEDRARLEARIAERGLGGRVRLAGALDQGAVRELLATATVMCLPCLVGADGNRDALPTVLLEALASGLPSISTPVSGVPEILDGGRAGVLVPESDAASTAEAIADLLADQKRRERIRAAGAARAAELFDLEQSAARLRSWIEPLLATGAARERPTCASPA